MKHVERQNTQDGDKTQTNRLAGDILQQQNRKMRGRRRPTFQADAFLTRNAFCGTWYLPHSHVHNKRTVQIIMAGCIAHARNGRISTFGLKSDVTFVFLDPDFF